jgi:hypothetical protein
MSKTPNTPSCLCGESRPGPSHLGDLHPEGTRKTNYSVQADKSGDQHPEFRDQILVKPEHFAWLSKQCEILGTSKEEMVANVLQEWLPHHRESALLNLNNSSMIEMALADFILRHRSEFIPVDEKDVI